MTGIMKEKTEFWSGRYLERLRADLGGTIEDNLGNRAWDQQRVNSQAVANDWSGVVGLRNDIRRTFEAVNYGKNNSDATEICYTFDALASDEELLNAFSNIHALSILFLSIQQLLVERVEFLQEKVKSLIETESLRSE